MTISLLLPLRQRFLCRISLVLFLALGLTGITACQPAITVLQPSTGASPLPAATVVPVDHGLSVIGVEFDPPLDAAQIISTGGVSLIVAVCNSGQQDEHGVKVTAELQDAGGRRKAVELLKETVTVKTLTSGSVELVRFAQVTDLPLRSSYKLIVHVAPAAGETDLEDNVRVYDILIDGTR